MCCQEAKGDSKAKVKEEGKSKPLPATAKHEQEAVVIKQEPCTPETKNERGTPSEEAKHESKEHNAWGSKRSSTWTSSEGDWDADGWAGSDYGRGQWGYWYGSTSGYNDSWNPWQQNYANGQNWSWNKWNQHGWVDSERDAYHKQTSWGATITRAGTCDLFDAPTPKKASPGTSVRKIAKGSPAGTPKAEDDHNKDASEAAKELQKKHHAKYTRFYRSLDSLQLNLRHVTCSGSGLVGMVHCWLPTYTEVRSPRGDCAAGGKHQGSHTSCPQLSPAFKLIPLLDVIMSIQLCSNIHVLLRACSGTRREMQYLYESWCAAGENGPNRLSTLTSQALLAASGVG